MAYAVLFVSQLSGLKYFYLRVYVHCRWRYNFFFSQSRVVSRLHTRLVFTPGELNDKFLSPVYIIIFCVWTSRNMCFFVLWFITAPKAFSTFPQLFLYAIYTVVYGIRKYVCMCDRYVGYYYIALYRRCACLFYSYKELLSLFLLLRWFLFLTYMYWL